jgi:hypothetical protein
MSSHFKFRIRRLPHLRTARIRGLHAGCPCLHFYELGVNMQPWPGVRRSSRLRAVRISPPLTDLRSTGKNDPDQESKEPNRNTEGIRRRGGGVVFYVCARVQITAAIVAQRISTRRNGAHLHEHQDAPNAHRVVSSSGLYVPLPTYDSALQGAHGRRRVCLSLEGSLPAQTPNPLPARARRTRTDHPLI